MFSSNTQTEGRRLSPLHARETLGHGLPRAILRDVKMTSEQLRAYL
jgi:hypothetical protein